MDDDFEYHLKLPSSPYSDASKHSKADLNTPVIDYNKEPVVILLGWMGCNYKHLTKYSEIYEAKGCVTISYVASTYTCLFSPAKAKEHARKILQLLIDFSYEDNPVLFHIFSNGGSIMYQHIYSLFNTTAEFKHLRVCGSVFDSAPGQPRPINAIKALLVVFQRWNIIFRLFTAIFMFIYLYFTVIKHKILSVFMGSDYGDVYSFLKTDSSYLMPQLYLYSSADKLIHYEDIEQLIKFREDCLGVQVFKYKWTDSSHVKHFVSHREAYINTCYTFLDTCLTNVLNKDQTERCVTISYVASTYTCLFSPVKAKEHARKILQLLIDFSYEDNPVLFHIFSNGGSIMYQHIYSLFNTTAEFKHLRVCGSVFDSAPGQPRPINAIKALLVVFQRWNIIFRLFTAIFMFIYLYFTVIKHKILSVFMGSDYGDVYSFLKTDSSYLMPQLYLYSSADKLIHYEDIEQLIKFREDCLGVQVFKYKWTDSSHVKHFVSHREAYINTCYTFLDTCLTNVLNKDQTERSTF